MNRTIFSNHPSGQKMTIEREFNAPLDVVWQAWTDASLLDQWWAPHPWKTETKYQDFSEGGHWLYSMNGPEGEQHWARFDYDRIVNEKAFDGTDAFTDDAGNVNKELPGMQWEVVFTPKEDSTHVGVLASFASQEALQQHVEMGFKEGFAAAHDNLDRLLEKIMAGA